jgi:hypothetical protein
MSDNPTIRVDVYGQKPPKAATFGRGATNLAQINEATEARRNLSNRQSTGCNCPDSKDGES